MNGTAGARGALSWRVARLAARATVASVDAHRPRLRRVEDDTAATAEGCSLAFVHDRRRHAVAEEPTVEVFR